MFSKKLFMYGCSIAITIVHYVSYLLKRSELAFPQEWWTYVCMGPSDPHPNWHLGMRGTQHRAVMWRVWKEGGTGFLYWGANCYEKATIPSAEVLCLEFGLLIMHGEINIF